MAWRFLPARATSTEPDMLSDSASDTASATVTGDALTEANLLPTAGD